MKFIRSVFHPRQVLVLIYFIYIAGNLALYIGPVVVLGLVKFMVPIQLVRRACYRIMVTIYRAAVGANVFLFGRILGLGVEVTGLDDLRPDRDQVVLVNHQSWADILMVQNLFHRRAPIPKFIAKWQVVFIPLVGLICWAYEFPLVRRYSRDYKRKYPEKAGRDLWMLEKHFSRPGLSRFSIIIYADGTRYTPAKAAGQQSPFRHLLRPKAGGLTNVIRALGPKIDELLDLTIVYDCLPPVLLNLLAGQCRGAVVRGRRIRLADWFEKDAQGKFVVHQEVVAERLNELWAEKDEFIERVKADFHR